MCSGVRVVCFYDITQEHGRAAVSGRKLECVTNSVRALVREQSRQKKERKRQEIRRRPQQPGKARRKSNRRKTCVDEEDPAERLNERSDPDLVLDIRITGVRPDELDLDVDEVDEIDEVDEVDDAEDPS